MNPRRLSEWCQSGWAVLLAGVAPFAFGAAHGYLTEGSGFQLGEDGPLSALANVTRSLGDSLSAWFAGTESLVRLGLFGNVLAGLLVAVSLGTLVAVPWARVMRGAWLPLLPALVPVYTGVLFSAAGANMLYLSLTHDAGYPLFGDFASMAYGQALWLCGICFYLAYAGVAVALAQWALKPETQSA